MRDSVSDLLSFIDASPTPYHAVAEAVRRLEAGGWRALEESEVWELSPGDRRYVTRNDGSLIAFEAGAVSPADGGFRLVGAHTDSPNLRLKPRADVDAHGYRQLAVEPYGGLLLHTWLDRDLTIAGRVTLRDGGEVRSVLLDFGRPLLRIPALAIHLHREMRSEGLKLDPQKHSVPMIGLEGAPDLLDLVGTELRARGLFDGDPGDVLAYDLMLADTQPSGVAGGRGEFILAPRLDNLASCHAALSALVTCSPGMLPDFTRGLVLYDHEEVGSQSAQGAAGTFLVETLERSVDGYKGGSPQGLARAASRSMLISADMAHAVHPNYADRHEPGHQPTLGGGPVIKTHASQSYATDAVTAGRFASLCERAGVTPQHFVSRSDLPCGSTIGPISAARSGIRTVDVGNPMLSMHSCREMAGTADVEPMIDVMRLWFEGA
jgi:aspartyl aminopeptidase